MEIYQVGGCVRDRYMGVKPKDFDYVVVGSTPEEMLALGYKQVGADFPVFLNELGEEFALARTERKNGKGYHGFEVDASPEVTIQEDLSRRDLTINAMAHSDENGRETLIDPFCGMRDLNDKVLRHVSEAFAEDPVRVLRLARFYARFGSGWTVADETVELCKRMVLDGELNHLTRERVLMEFEKALGEKHPHLFFRFLRRVGALAVVLPEMEDCRAVICGTPTARHAYSRLVCFTDFDKDAFEERLNVQTSWREYRKMYETWMFAPPYEGLVEMLYRLDAYRKTDLFQTLCAATGDHDALAAYMSTYKIGFADLTEEQQKTLKGPEIAAAIRALRLATA